MNFKSKSKSYKITLIAILFAISLILSLVENSLPPVVFGIPGFRLGLSNIVTMFGLIYVSPYVAFYIAILKSFFVFLIRGGVASFLSFSGGIASILIMLLLLVLFKDKISGFLLSILGAITHNLFQVLAIMLIMQNFYFMYYIPVLVVLGIISGGITSAILSAINKNLKNQKWRK